MTGAALSLVDLGCRSGGAVLLDGLHAELAPGERVGLIGLSGAGKTALLDAIGGLLPRAARSVLLDGRPLGGPPHRIARRGVGRTFERPPPLPGATVQEALILAATLQEGARLDALLRRPDEPPRRLVQAVRAVMLRLGLEELADHPPNGLPAPVPTLLDLARALLGRPRLLLLDQPFRGHGARQRERIAAVIEELGEQGITLLLAEHDITLVAALCPRVLVLDRGRLLADGRPEEVGADPAVLEAFTGAREP